MLHGCPLSYHACAISPLVTDLVFSHCQALPACFSPSNSLLPLWPEVLFLGDRGQELTHLYIIVEVNHLLTLLCFNAPQSVLITGLF